MKVKYKVLMLTLTLSTMGFAKVYAEQPISSKHTPVIEKPSVEVEETSSVLTFSTDNNELIENDYLVSDSCLNDVGLLINFNQPKYPLDSANYKGILDYIKYVMPAIKDLKKQDVEMIEIL